MRSFKMNEDLNKPLTQEEIRASDDPMDLVVSRLVELRKKVETNRQTSEFRSLTARIDALKERINASYEYETGEYCEVCGVSYDPQDPCPFH
tara:strand:+ start:371 stop:646 length:276 start_codon:yes stop_codon:yes gene_type:complete